MPTVQLVGPLGGVAAFYIDVETTDRWVLRGGAGTAWVRPSQVGGSGPTLIRLHVAKNAGPERHADYALERSGRSSRVYRVLQGSAAPLHAQSDMVLGLPRFTVPRVIELGIAAKYLAQQIRKIPEPFDLIALVVAELLLLLATLVGIGLRAGFTEAGVPDPPSPFGVPDLPIPPAVLEHVPSTDLVLIEEGFTAAIYLALQVLEA